MFQSDDERELSYSLCTEVVGTFHQELHAVDRDDAHEQKADGSDLDRNRQTVCGPCKKVSHGGTGTAHRVQRA